MAATRFPDRSMRQGRWPAAVAARRSRGSETGTLRARAAGRGASSPNTSLAIAPMPPSEPISDDASSGIRTILLLLAVPMRASASVYFCATK